jgi:hypothetical protein
MRKNVLLLGILLLLLVESKAQFRFVNHFANQNELQESANPLDLEENLSTELNIEPFLGVSASLSYGELIRLQKSFHQVSEEGTEFQGNISPVIWATGGVQVRYVPFTEGILSNLGISIGIQYLQKGFINQFKSTHNSKLGFMDVTDYREVNRFNYLSIPIQARWGKKLFGTVGFSISSYLSGNKAFKLAREQSGENSVDGGFKDNTRESKSIEKTVVNKSPKDFLIGGGINFNDNFTMSARANIGSKILVQKQNNFNTLFLEFSILKTFKFSLP